MRYRIEYADGRCCNFANSRKDLLDWLKALKDEKVVDIRKVYKNGVTDSVIDSYRSYTIQKSVLNAWDYGVPQKRERLITVGIRNDLFEKIHFDFPEPHDYKPVMVQLFL